MTADAALRRTQGEHPRLFFDADELARLRAESQSGLRARLLERIRGSCHTLMDPASEQYLDFHERTSATWTTRKGIFKVHPALGTLALGYAFLEDTAIGDFARDATMTIIEEGLADTDALAYAVPTKGWRHGAGHDKHNFALGICLVYDLCYDRFSDAQRGCFAEYARESIKIAYDEAWMQDWFQVANNRGVRGILAGTYYALTLEGDAEIDKLEWQIKEGELAVEHFLYLAYGRDGAPFEGPGYGGGLHAYALAAEAIRQRGGPNLLTNNRFERLQEYQLYQLLPGGGSLDPLNDANPGCGSIIGSLHLLGHPGGELLPWLAQQLDLHPDKPTNLFADESGAIGPPAIPVLKWWKDDLPAPTPHELGYPLSRFFEDRGVAAMRTGWGANDWLVTHFCGRQQYKCHRQSDQNHINFYALGEHFLIDAGYGVRHNDMTKAMDRYFGLTEAHNCVLIDGADQRGTGVTQGWVEGEMLDWQHTDAFDTTLGDASSAVGPDHRIRRSLRRVVHVKRGPATYLAVLDVNEKDGQPFTASALWHTTPGNHIERTESGFLIRGQGSDCHAIVLSPADTPCSIEDGYGRPRARLDVTEPVTEMLTIFCPRRRDEAVPTFTGKRLGEGAFEITCELADSTSVLRLTTAVTPPLRTPVPVHLEYEEG